MLEVRNIEVFGLNRAINAIHNSFNVGEIDTTQAVTERREKVALALGRNMDAHQSHDAFLKGILVTFDMKHHGVVMPEFQRYHFAEIVMSQSTVHSLEKFILGESDPYSKYVTQESKEQVKRLYRAWLDSGKSYDSYMTLRHNLPQGFEMWATVTSNYLQLKTICIQRQHHRNREDWDSFIRACYSMPRFRDLTGLADSRWDV